MIINLLSISFSSLSYNACDGHLMGGKGYFGLQSQLVVTQTILFLGRSEPHDRAELLLLYGTGRRGGNKVLYPSRAPECPVSPLGHASQFPPLP